MLTVTLPHPHSPFPVQLNVLELEDDLDLLEDPCTQPWLSNTLKPLRPFERDEETAFLPSASQASCKAGAEGLPCPAPDHASGGDSNSLDASVWPERRSPPPRPLTPPSPPRHAADVHPSWSGPPLVPTSSSHSQDHLSPGTADPEQAPSESGGAASTPEATRSDTSPAATVAMPMVMPMQMPMQPFMQWPLGGMVMPVCHPWATYMPQSLIPPTDTVAREAVLEARRAKRERFQYKKRQLSCRKTVRYASRKRYADSRPRVNGRFIRKSDCTPAARAGAA